MDDILSEKRIIQREKKLNISMLANLVSKDAILLMMTILQAALYYYISSWVLGMRGFALPWIVFFIVGRDYWLQIWLACLGFYKRPGCSN